MDQQEKLLKFQKAVFAEIEQMRNKTRPARWNKLKKRCLPKRKTSCMKKRPKSVRKTVAKQQNAVWS